MSIGVRVRAGEAESVKNRLKDLGVLDVEKRVMKEGGYVLFPVLRPIEGYEVVEADFETLERVGLEEMLSAFMSGEELEKVRYSFDVVGDIAIIEVPVELQKWGPRIGESLMTAHNHIKAVYMKSGGIKGEERVREYVHLSGDVRTVTLHREHGCTFKVDISKAYFSPRLSYERERVLKLTRDGEVIVDMFAGVGPFAIILAKHRNVKVYAIDVNAHAFEFLKENIRLNKVQEKVTPLLGDSKSMAPKGVAGRVIMNLPMKASQFLGDAMKVIKSGTIHFYALADEKDLFDSWAKFIRKAADEKGRKVEIIGTRIVRPYAPRRYHVVIDIGVLS